jgi:multidrug efflux pump subunit AcrA (membrane-fusion protein)
MTAPASRLSEDEANPNGSPSQRRVPPQKKAGMLRKYSLYFWVGGLFFLLLTGVGAYLLLWRLVIGTPFAGPTWTVKKETLRVTIVERGSLESAENSDLIVRVKAGIKGSTNASTIKWVVDDGMQVKAGDPVCDLDDSGYQDQLKSQRNTFNRATADWVGATNDTDIQASQNISDIKTSEVNLITAQLELKKYAGEAAGTKMITMETQNHVRKYLMTAFEDDVRKESAQSEGKFTSAYLQDISVIEGNIETARSDKDSWLDRAAWSQRMVKKGFYSLSQADADQSRLSAMEISLRRAQGDLDIYRIFEREKNVTIKWSAVKEAERAVNRVEIQANSMMKQKQADESSKKSIYDQELDRLRDMEKDEKFYRMTAPQTGMIVYYIPEQQRFGSGAQQGTVAQGEPVREGQKLIRIPNLAKMLVNARVHEAMVSKVRGEQIRMTGYTDTLRFGLTLGRHDPIGLAAYYTGFEEFRDEYRDKLRDKDQTVVFPGHKAKIRIDAFPGKQYEGHVKTVATVASQAEFFSSDVKVYQTMVSIEDLDPSSEKLKPGMSAEVTILADETTHPVLVIPIQAVVGNVSMKAERKCYVLDAKNIPHERDIVVGLSNDKLVEVVSGLEEGEKIVLNPRPLIPEKSDMKPGTPGTRRGAEFDDAGKKGGKKKGDEGPKGSPEVLPTPGKAPEGQDRKTIKKMP